MAGLPGPLSPEAIAAGESYDSGQLFTPAPVAGPYASRPELYFGPDPAPPAPIGPPNGPTAPALPPGVDPSWLQGQAPNTAALGAMPAPETVKPGQPLFGGPTGAPTMPAQPPLAPSKDPSAPTPAIPFGPPKELAAPPGGPTAQDDREFAALRKLQEAKRPASGGGGGAPADPYGAENRAILDSYRMQGEGAQMQADAESARAKMRAEHLVTAARHREEDAAIALQEQSDADTRFNEMQADAQKQLDEVRAQKIDPDRLMRGDGMAIMAMIGGAIGGVYQGLNKLASNPFIDQLNKQIDRDIAVQEKNIDHARQGAVDKMNLLRDQRAQWKDSQMARLQARSLAYEATIAGIEAEAAKYDDPIIQGRAAQALGAVQREQATVQKAIKAEQARLAAAAAGAGMADVKARRAAYLDLYKNLTEHGVPPAAAEAEAARQMANLFGNGAPARDVSMAGGANDPIGMVPKEQRQKALEEQEKYAGAQAAKKAIQQVFSEYEKSPDLPTYTGAKGREAVLKSGLLTVRQALGEGFSSDKDTITYVEGNLPSYGESAATRQQKLAGLLRFLDGKATTPILDRHAPGWRGGTKPQTYDVNGKPNK